MSTDSAAKFDIHKWLPWLIFGGVILGIALGGAFPLLGKELGFVGDLFMRALMMLVVPLVMTSIIVGISQLGDVRKLGGLARKSIFYFLGTTFLAAALGLGLVSIVQPGVGTDALEKTAEASQKVSQEIPSSEIAKEKVEALGEELRKEDETAKPALTQEQYKEKVLDPSATDTERSQNGTADSKADSPSSDLVDPTSRIAEVNPASNSTPSPSSPVQSASKSGAVSSEIEGESIEKKKLESAAKTEEGETIEENLEEKTPDIFQVFKDIVVNLVPKNLFKAMVNTDLLPIIIFSLVFGAVVTTIGERGTVVIQFFQGANDAIMKIVDLLMLVAPVGICCLIAGRLGEAGGIVQFADELSKLGKYATTVMGGLFIHSVIVLPLILLLLARPKCGVVTYFTNLWAAILTAFSTASSAAALPITMESVIESGVARRNANFVLPLGTTLNMNGTALYEAVAAVFIAQISGVHLDSVHMILIAVTASLAAVGAASIPEAGLVTMLIVLKAAGLPTEHVSLILIIDWFLDRCRTAVNVWGDAVGAAVIDRFEPVVESPLEATLESTS